MADSTVGHQVETEMKHMFWRCGAVVVLLVSGALPALAQHVRANLDKGNDITAETIAGFASDQLPVPEPASPAALTAAGLLALALVRRRP